MGAPAYTRLENDERRRRLLELGARLFTEHAYDEISMARIAREAGISKALLYHYFPSKEAYFVATLEEKAAELAERTQPDESLPPLEQLAGSLDAYLRWVAENAGSYEKMIRSASVPEVRAMLDRVRGDTAQRIVDGIRGEHPETPVLRTAVNAWLWFMDGACLDWIEHGRDMPREELHGLLLATLVGAVLAAGEGLG
jgi:AcrR family transcriptional regulator